MSEKILKKKEIVFRKVQFVTTSRYDICKFSAKLDDFSSKKIIALVSHSGTLKYPFRKIGGSFAVDKKRRTGELAVQYILV